MPLDRRFPPTPPGRKIILLSTIEQYPGHRLHPLPKAHCRPFRLITHTLGAWWRWQVPDSISAWSVHEPGNYSLTSKKLTPALNVTAGRSPG